MSVSLNRRKLLALLGMGAFSGFFTACSGKSTSELKQGDRFPELELFNLEGGVVPLSAFSGASLVLNFWASWCEPCRREMPSLQKLSTLYSHEELLVVGVTVDSDVNLAREFVMQHGLTFPMLLDRDMKFSNGILGIAGFPMTYLLAADRTIASVVAGERNWLDPDSITEIESLLKVRRIHAD